MTDLLTRPELEEFLADLEEDEDRWPNVLRFLRTALAYEERARVLEAEAENDHEAQVEETGELENALDLIAALEEENRLLGEKAAKNVAQKVPLHCEGAVACASCGGPASCLGAYEGNGLAYGCDVCCGHGCEDGYCIPLAKVPGHVAAILETSRTYEEKAAKWDTYVAQNRAAQARWREAHPDRKPANPRTRP